MFAAGTGNVSGLQVLLDKQANPIVEDYQATTQKDDGQKTSSRRFHVGLPQFFLFNSIFGWCMNHSGLVMTSE